MSLPFMQEVQRLQLVIVNVGGMLKVKDIVHASARDVPF